MTKVFTEFTIGEGGVMKNITTKSEDLEPLIDKRIAAAFRARARKIRSKPYEQTRSQIADDWDASANELDPPAKPAEEKRYKTGQRFIFEGDTDAKIRTLAFVKETRMSLDGKWILISNDGQAYVCASQKSLNGEWIAPDGFAGKPLDGGAQ